MYEALISHLRECAKLDPTENTFSEAADAIAELMQKTQQLPRWIPVEERLPEHLSSVLVHSKDGGIFCWEYFDSSPTDECWIDDYFNVFPYEAVTHWMPLPEPPKEVLTDERYTDP